ncbi:TolC family outer membrane protein [Crenalkalicoccus roseus]|uniref:TolC family outer membrane protein n=1 Tax=Crenalkalicoccus roseus TaxID=1485588 RepID=UPI00107FEFAC|nr:TolC family outer membrane protein [Crenalkalicoccus roseus]
MRLTRFALALTTALLVPPALVAAARPARAQTLQEALALAYANNPTLLAARAQLRAVDENVPQALAGWRPTVSITSSVGVIDSQARQAGITREADRTTTSNALTITQPLFRGGRTVAATRRAENQVLAQRARLLATEQQVLQETVSAYVNVVRFQEELRLQINNEQVLTEQLRATNERFRVGEITRTDVAQAESRLAGARSARASAEGQLQIARATFQRLTGMPPQRLTAPQPLRPPVRSAEEAAQLAGLNNPNVVAALFDEAAARDNVDIQISQLLPSVSLQGQAFRNENAQTRGTTIEGTQITASLTVPLYQGGAEYAAVRQARQVAVQQRQVVADQRRIAAQQATQAWEQLQATRAQVESVRAQIRAAEIALDGVQREAIVGSRTTLDVLNAEQELLNARTALVQALSTVVSQSYVLAAAVGRLTAQDLGLPVEIYDMRAYYQQVRNRWIGLGGEAEPPELQVMPAGR